MELGKAMDTARKLKNHFRAFEELEAFVNEVASLQSSHTQALADHESLKVQNQTLNVTIENLKAELATLVNERDTLDETVKAKNKEITEHFDKALADGKAELEAQLQGLKDQVDAAQKDFDAKRVEMQEAIEGLNAQKDEADEAFRVASERLQALKESL